MIKYFRSIAYLEGLSFLVLLGVAMPLKYLFGQPIVVKIMGWAHGIFFMVYVLLVTSVSTDERWGGRKILWAFLAGILPFGPFVFDRLLHYSQPISKATS